MTRVDVPAFEPTAEVHARRRRRLLASSLCSAFAAFVACGGGGSEGAVDAYDDPRTRQEMCVTYCENAAQHGCPSISGWPCEPACEAIYVQGNRDCLRLYDNHTACLADVPDLCDAAMRDEYCLDAMCAFRRACNLPTPQCR